MRYEDSSPVIERDVMCEKTLTLVSVTKDSSPAKRRVAMTELTGTFHSELTCEESVMKDFVEREEPYSTQPIAEGYSLVARKGVELSARHSSLIDPASTEEHCDT